MKKLAILFTLLLLPATGALAWGEKGHTLANEAATTAVPYEMPAFFHDAYPGLVYLGYDPDRWRGAGTSFDPVGSQDHFLDYEYVESLGPLPDSRYEFIKLLESSGILKKEGIELETPGFVPWRVAEVSELLERQWRLWSNETDPIEKRQIEQNIIHFAGVLGHYVADSANPHHATKEYNGWTSPNPNGYRTNCETHFRFESLFVTKNVSLRDITPYMQPPQRRDNYFDEALGFIRASNTQIETLYTLDRDGAFDGRGTPAGLEFAARRIALGGSWLRDLWWSTYLNGTAKATRRR